MGEGGGDEGPVAMGSDAFEADGEVCRQAAEKFEVCRVGLRVTPSGGGANRGRILVRFRLLPCGEDGGVDADYAP